jgi:hypothetical protein
MDMSTILDLVKEGPKQSSTADVLAERSKTHGDFEDNARTMQKLKHVIRKANNWVDLSDVQKEALDMICVKIGRIVTGNPYEPDHWLDISGYATLALREIQK